MLLAPVAMGSHRGAEDHQVVEKRDTGEMRGHPIPGASFQVFLGKGKEDREMVTLDKGQAEQTVKTVVEALSEMVAHRTQHKRFDEALTKKALSQVIIEPRVFNRDGKEFSFLVARTKQKGRVNLLINALALKEQGYLNHPEQLVPVLAREFQWVVSKADTTQKRVMALVIRDLKKAPIHTNLAIRNMSGKEREQALQDLFRTYLTTVDNYESLKDHPYYEVGSIKRISPDQPESTIKLYDIRVRKALQIIVSEPYFQEHTPKATRALLNGKIWNVSYVNIESRDWATRTRVVPKDQSVTVGEKAQPIQPAKVLVNVHRLAAPDDPFYAATKDLPMGALAADQLARVIALEIENQIIEKSMRGHVAADEHSTPK